MNYGTVFPGKGRYGMNDGNRSGNKNKKAVKSDKKHIKHDPQAESARIIFGKEQQE